MASLKKRGTILNICTSFQYHGSRFITLNEAVDFLKTFPFSIKTKESKSFIAKLYCCNNFCPAADCKAAKLKIPFLSCFKTKLTAPLQKLQTPSKRITGFSVCTRQN